MADNLNVLIRTEKLSRNSKN